MSLPFPAAVIHAVLQAGTGEFVVCAGARNSALVIVLAALGDKVRLWQHFDERAAGFFALGRIRATGNPVAVVTTSGTAAAELLPAVIEAHYRGLPLVALTADRPKRYRGSGAPQAIEQSGIFTVYARCFDCEEQAPALSTRMGDSPLHVNICLEEPDAAALASLREEAGSIPHPEQRLVEQPKPDFPSTPISADLLVMTGDGPGDWVSFSIDRCLRLSGLVCAEAASGLREIPQLKDRMIKCGEATLRHLPLRHVVRLGSVPSLRFWRDLESNPGISVHAAGRYPGLARDGIMHYDGDPLYQPEPRQAIPAAGFLARDAALYAKLGELLTRFPHAEPALLRRLSQVIPQGATVFTGNSLAVREWNLCAEYGRGHRVHVLRGANGIDGNLSAFLGIAADQAEAWCITGDLTALYDLSAPWMLPQLPPGKRRFVVIQNGGGKIFSRLPSLRGLNERERSLMENPHDIRLRGWAEMWHMDHLSGGAEILDNVDAVSDHAVIELYPDAAQTEEFWLAWAHAEKEIWL